MAASPPGQTRAMKMTRNSNQFRCGERLRDGSVCDEAFTRAGNLQRHLRVQHQAEMPARFRFIQMVPDGHGGLQEVQDEGHCQDDHPGATVEEPSWKAAMDQMSRNAESIAMHTSSIVSAVTKKGGAIRSDTGKKAGRGELPRAGAGDASPRRARDTVFRFGRGIYIKPMPSYVVKRSRHSPSQQCALSWLSQKTKQKVDRTVSRLMRSWGVAPDHTTSCILVPAKWKSRNPAQVLSELKIEDFTAINSTRLELKADDHQTSFARAAAWFGEWGPRRGIDLDNLLEAGPFQRMKDGSHLCHQRTCINRNHLKYEPSHINLGRIACSDEAQQTRRNGEVVPWGCSLHDPPCLLQLAALTPFEAVLIQRFVFNQGAADRLPQPPPRPRQHRYPTFETKIPVSFAADRNTPDPTPPTFPRADPTNAPRGRVPRPELCCPFCLAARRAFNSVTGFWGHVLHNHDDKSDDERAAAVRSSARDWERYWLAKGFTPPPDSPTLLRITQALSPGFSWADVRSWNLRQ